MVVLYICQLSPISDFRAVYIGSTSILGAVVMAGLRGCFCTGAEVGAGLRGRWFSEEAEPCSSAEVTMVVIVAVIYGEPDGQCRREWPEREAAGGRMRAARPGTLDALRASKSSSRPGDEMGGAGRG
jgi:hypothetical protein